MRDLRLDTSLAHIFARETGERNHPLVLGIHGWSRRNGWHTWEPLMAPLAAAGFRVVCVDMPGWGQSVPKRAGWSPAKDAVTTVIEILDALQSQTAVLLGKSWGGGVALRAALKHPERITRLILTAPALPDLTPLAGLGQPVLLAWSRDDPVIPHSRAAAYIEQVPHIELVSYDTGGHSAAQANAADFAPRAVAFMRS